MAAYDNLRAVIAANVYQNNNNKVTADMVKTAMNEMVNYLGAEFQFGGVAKLTPTQTDPGTPDYKVAYIASEPGTYTHFGGLVVADGEVVNLKWDGTAWSKEVTGATPKYFIEEKAVLQDVEPTPPGEPERYYITDKNRVVLGYIDKDGAITWLAKTDKQKQDAAKLDNLQQEVTVSGMDNHAFLTDKDRRVIGYVDNTGGVYFYKLLNGAGEDGLEKEVTKIMAAVGTGGYGDVTLNLMNKSQTGSVSIPGMDYTPRPLISFTDDDSYDCQIPESNNWQAGPDTPPSGTNATNGVGFVSILYPFVKSINERFLATMKGRASFGIAAEGQRIGLTGLYKDVDEFDGSLNLGGRLLKGLATRAGWNICCHSMTARYIAKSYWVESMEDPLVAEIEAAADTNHAPNEWHLSYIHCEDTGLDYEYRSTGWHLVSDHYIRPYLAKTLAADAPLFFNPRYSQKYQVEQWKKRAKMAGLPITDCVISWGTSPCRKFLIEDFKFYKSVFLSPGNTVCNSQPLNSSVMKRVNYAPSSNNAWDDALHARLIAQVDACVNNGAWLVFMAHSYESVCKNCYLDGVDYGTRRDDNYPAEWVVPLKYEELKTMDENNYWEIPPARLGISSWGEWYPCPGTTYDMLLDVVEYAISQGIEFGSIEDGIARFGNPFNLGLKFGAQSEADSRLDPSEVESWWWNYIIQQNDGSILYNVTNN